MPLTGGPAGVARWSSTRLSPAGWSTASSRSGRSFRSRPVEVDGWDNRTFRLGAELSVRLPSGDWYAQQVDKEQRWLPVLAPQLPLPIPAPVAQGEPGEGYPYPWSVYRWLAGEPAASGADRRPGRFAADLAGFLRALRGVDATGGPEPGQHNFFRGGPLATTRARRWRRSTRSAARSRATPSSGVGDAMATVGAEPVWVHGDVAPATCSSATAGWRP